MSEGIWYWILGAAAVAAIFIFRKLPHWRIHRAFVQAFLAWRAESSIPGPTPGEIEIVSCIATLAYATRHNKSVTERTAIDRLRTYGLTMPGMDIGVVLGWLSSPFARGLLVTPVAVALLAPELPEDDDNKSD